MLRRLNLLILSVAASLMLNAPGVAQESHPPIDRAAIEALFSQTDSDATTTPQWKAFEGKTIQWQGTLHTIRRRQDGSRMEYRIKILPQSLLYDTIAVLEDPQQTEQAPQLEKGEQVVLTGTIIHGTDVSGIHQVIVRLQQASSIRRVRP